MSSRTATALGLLALVLSGAPAAVAKAPVRHSTARSVTVVIYEGIVDAKSAQRFVNLISENTDKVIGLKLVVEPSREGEERYFVSRGDDDLTITVGDPFDGPVELVINGPTGRTMAMHTVDGFYLIKSGGMHTAGAISFGARPADEAKIRLNPNIRIVTRKF